MKHSDYVNIIEGFGKKTLTEALIKAVVKHLPFFTTGPFNYLLVKIATKLIETMIEEGEVRIFFKFIDFRTDAQAKDFEAAMLRNHTMQQIGTPDEKKKAELELVDALNKLVHLTK